MIHPPTKRSNKFLASSAVQFLAAALVLGLVPVQPLRAADPSTVPALKRVEAKSQAVAAKAVEATVGIINQALTGGGHMGEGSGVVVSEDGLVLTAGHVLGQPGADLTVVFADGRRAAAKSLGANFSRDSGLAKITEPGKWPHVEMGRSDDLKPGAWCMALGHPGGVQQGRTPPIRLGRILVAGKNAKYLVSDATVISGDSGGPLFDLDGRVIGIHSNIGTSVNQNQHVPIDVYRSQWTELVAGKTFGSPHDLQPLASLVSPEKLQRFQELFFQKMLAGDPEAQALVKGDEFRATPEDIDRLIAKWEQPAAVSKPPDTSAAAASKPAATSAASPSKPADTSAAAASKPPAAANGANEPLDFLKFQRLFQERLLAADPEVLKLIKDGKMMLAPAQMRQLMDEWEKKSLAASAPKAKPAGSAEKPATGKAAGPSPAQPQRTRPYQRPLPPKAKPEDIAKLREMMRNAEPLGDGRYRFHGSDDELSLLPGWSTLSRAMSYGKSSPQILQQIAPIAAQAGRSTVVVLCNGKPTVLGTVVRKDGYILTKSSELRGTLLARSAGGNCPPRLSRCAASTT